LDVFQGEAKTVKFHPFPACPWARKLLRKLNAHCRVRMQQLHAASLVFICIIQ
jgi:hypothetical protein